MKITFLEKNHHGQIQEIGVEYDAILLGTTTYLGGRFYTVKIENDAPRSVGAKSVKAVFTIKELIEFPHLVDFPSNEEVERARNIIKKFDERRHYERMNSIARERIDIAKKYGFSVTFDDISLMSDEEFDKRYGWLSLKTAFNEMFKA